MRGVVSLVIYWPIESNVYSAMTNNGIPAAAHSHPEKPSGELFACPTCGLMHDAPDRPCPRCGFIFPKGPDTLQVDFRSMANEYAQQLRGDAFIAHPNPVTFEIDGEQFTLPQGNRLVIGRRSFGAEQGPQPDVDLSRFSATQRGVSRTHMRLERRSNLLYIADLESRNGTWLNGKRLLDKGERLLRDGDRIMLGKLEVVVHF